MNNDERAYQFWKVFGLLLIAYLIYRSCTN